MQCEADPATENLLCLQVLLNRMHGAGYCCLRPSAILLLSVGIMQLYQPVAAARYHLSITRDSEPSRLMSITQNTTADGFLQKLSKLGSPCNNSTIPTAANASHGTAKALKTESEGVLPALWLCFMQQRQR